MSEAPVEMCHCGQAADYSGDPATEQMVRSLIETAGEYITVNWEGRSWKV